LGKSVSAVSNTVSSRADEVLRRIERQAERRYLPIIGPKRGRILAELVRKGKPKRILEVGTLVGYSTILMGRELEGDSEIVTVEIDEGEVGIAEENIKEAEIRARVRVLAGDASDVIQRLNGEFDLVFLDADKGDYLTHLRLVESRLHKGSIVIADNAGAYAFFMREYLHYVRDSGKYKSQFIPSDGDGVEVSIKL